MRYRCSDDYYNVVLHQSSQPGFRNVGLMLQDDDQYEVLRGRLEARNILNTSFVSFSDIEVGAGNAVPIDLIETCEREFSHERI